MYKINIVMRQKVVHIIPRLDYFGGIENYILNLLRYANSSNYQIIVITFYSQNNKNILSEFSSSSIEIHHLKKSLFEKIKLKYIRFLLKNTLFAHYHKYRSLKKNLFNIKPDLIYTHGEDSEIISSLLTEDYKIVNVIHGSDYFPSNPILRFYLKKISRKDFLHTVLVSSTLRNQVPPKLNYTIIFAGIDLNRFIELTKSEFLDNEKIRLGFIGRLEKQKGIHNLIEAFIRLSKFHSNITLEIAGKGKEEKKLKTRVPQTLHSKVIFHGNLENITSFYKNIDVLVICSESEGGPLVLLEAMAAGVLVITNSVGIVSEIIVDKKNARLLSNNSPEEIFRIMKETIEESDRNKFIIKNAKEIVKNFSSPKMVNEFDLLSSNLILKNRSEKSFEN